MHIRLTQRYPAVFHVRKAAQEDVLRFHVDDDIPSDELVHILVPGKE